MREKTKELLPTEIKQADAEQQTTAVLEEPEQEQAEEKLFHSAPIKIGMAAPLDPPPFENRSQNNRTVNFFQKSYGNLSTLRHFNYPIQAKLTISQPNDPYEQEADRIADEIMRTPETEIFSDRTNSATRSPQSAIQRKHTCPLNSASSCKEDEEIRKINLARNQITGFAQRQANLLQPKESKVNSSEVQPGIVNRIQSLGSGNPLPESVRSYFEPRFGQDFSDVRLHTDRHVAQAAWYLNASAFTIGRDIYFGHGQFRPGTKEGDKLIAHELTHSLQQRAVSGASRVHTSSREAFAINQSRKQQCDETKPRQVENKAIERGAISPFQAHLHIQTQPAPSGATQTEARFDLGSDLESFDPVRRVTALYELARRDDFQSWSALLLAQQSVYADVRTEAENLIRYRIQTTPSFEIYLREMAESPSGVLSDLAIKALVGLGAGGLVPAENYRQVVRQRLALARLQLIELDDILYHVVISAGGGTHPREPVIPTPAVDRLEGSLDFTPADDMWEIGLKASNLLDRLSIILSVARGLQSGMGQTSEGGVRKLMQSQLIFLLMQARRLTGEEGDSAFDQILASLGEWPRRFASTLVEEMCQQFLKARDSLHASFNRRLYGQGQAAQQGWQRIRTEVQQPLEKDLNTMIEELNLLRPVAKTDPDLVFGQLQTLEPILKSIGERALYLMQSANMMDLFEELVLTGDAARDLLQDTQAVFWQLADLFAQLAAKRDEHPEEARKIYEEIVSKKEYKQALETVQKWREIQEGELRFAQFLTDVLIILVSLETGGLAYGLVRGLFGRALTLGGRIAVGALAIGAEATAFTLTSRTLRWAIYGEDFTKGFGKELGLNFLLFVLMRGAGATYQKFGAPRLPLALRPAGALGTTFVAFQAWSVTLHAFEPGGEILWPTNPKFWQMAAQNAIFLAAIHLGRPIVKPFFAPVENAVIKLEISRHNSRSEQLRLIMESWEKSENPDYDHAVDIVRRARTLYQERLDLLRRIHQTNPSDLSAEELRYAETVLQDQIQAAENSLFQSRFRLRPHETAPNTFYYEGDAEAFRRHYEHQGYRFVEIDPETGRMRLVDPKGEIIDLIRTRMAPGGAEKVPQQLAAEAQYERIRQMRDDTAAIARNTNIPERVIRQVKTHLFLQVHRIPVAPGEVREMRFTPDPDIARLWTAASEGPLSGADLSSFRSLMAHEYVELTLMRRGLLYHSSNPKAWTSEGEGDFTYWPSAEHFGAHDLAPLSAPERSPFEHWKSLFNMPVTREQAQKLGVPIEDWMQIKMEEPQGAAGAGPSATVAETARNLTASIRAAGEPVIINIGGTGAPHEPANAINVNPNRVAPRFGIPNHVEARGEDIGSLFAPGSVDQVVGHHLPPMVLDWNAIAEGAFKIMRSGGVFEVYFRGAHPIDAANCRIALVTAGFGNVNVISDVLIRAEKP